MLANVARRLGDRHPCRWIVGERCGGGAAIADRRRGARGGVARARGARTLACRGAARETERRAPAPIEPSALRYARRGAAVLLVSVGTRDRRDVGGVHVRRSISELCLLYTSPSPRDRQKSRMPSSA